VAQLLVAHLLAADVAIHDRLEPCVPVLDDDVVDDGPDACVANHRLLEGRELRVAMRVGKGDDRVRLQRLEDQRDWIDRYRRAPRLVALRGRGADQGEEKD
jgi:hypothetical protein